MSSNKKIIIVVPFISGFIQNDIDILSKEYDVLINIYDWKKKMLTPFFLIYQFFFFIKNVKTADKIIIHFGGYWSFIPTLFGRISRTPSFIVLHGTDCSNLSLINYGSLRKCFLKLFCGASYKLATKLLPVSSSLVFIKNTYSSNDKYSFQGYKHFFPKNNTPFTVIANGVDFNYWKPLPNVIREENSFIAVFSKGQFILKGGDLIVSLAESFPNYKFLIAGVGSLNAEYSIPKNLFLLGRLTKDELRAYYQKSQFHFQLSIFEGFGLSLCEAMLCGCIPVGSSVNAIPEIIGGTGFVLEKKSIEELKILIHEIVLIVGKTEKGIQARKRIVENYNLEKRSVNLLMELNKY